MALLGGLEAAEVARGRARGRGASGSTWEVADFCHPREARDGGDVASASGSLLDGLRVVEAIREAVEDVEGVGNARRGRV